MIVSDILGDGIGEIELVDSMGSDLTVVNSARISFGGKSEKITDRDKKLIKYLATNEHTSPFRHSFLSFRIKAPEMVMRQWYKHVIGCSWTSPEFHNHGWNEISGRYKEVDPEFYHITKYRKQSEDNKQASEGEMEFMPNTICRSAVHEATDLAFKSYKMMLGLGVSKEQARMVLPLSLYTEVIWTGSLQAMHNFVKLRDHEHAQEEIRLYAQAISSACETKFPHSWAALTR
jgi:thymidylate synthase (FAD)